MAQKNIDFGTFPDDPDADAIRTAFQKVQDNFTELYNNREEAVYSVNRTPGAGITVNGPTGNVVVTANISEVRIQSSTLDLSAGSPYPAGPVAVITKGSVPFFINLPANVTGISNINLSDTLTANTINVNFEINGNIARFTGDIVTSSTLDAVNVSTYSLTVDSNANVNNNLNVLGNANVTSNINASNITSSGLISATTSNVSGNVNAGNVISSGLVSATTSNVSGNVNANRVNANVANINSNLSVSGTTELGLVGNVKIQGGTVGQVLTTDGAANLSFGTVGEAQNVLYVSKNGNDSNDGKTLQSAKLTIAAAVAIATPNTTIFVKAGDYTEQNPMSLANRVTIVGDNLRTVSVRPANPTQDIFWVRNGCYITGVTFRSHLSPSAAVAFPKRLFTGSISGTTLTVTSMSSPLNDIRVGMYVTGTGVAPNTQITALGTGTGGVGTYTVSVSQTVGSTSMTGAEFIVTSPYTQNCSSITTTGCGMRIDGSLALGLRSMVLDSYTQFNQGGKGIHIINQGYAQLVSIFTICCTIGVHCESGGQCSVANSNNSFGDYALVSDGQSPILYSGTVVSFINGVLEVTGLSVRPTVNDSFQFVGDSTWYTVNSASNLVGGTSIVQYSQPPGNYPTPGTVVNFYQPSFISASGQTFEYVGTGTDILTATPRLGGVPIRENEVIQMNGGIVNWTSTDQFGDFRIGEGLTVNEEAGVIEGPAFEKGLFAVLTPYILALENN